MSAYDPLYDPAVDGIGWTPPLDIAITCARESLAKHQCANIHDHTEVLRAATALEFVLRDLLNAHDELDALLKADAAGDGA
ncbi:hypothetical protein SLUN_12950 [Streptomyces lunaelactis]|uniref:Uncharacterized protein n=1 Tax=Streptomyces lunaelactis TaxID=1535768 RepID=A0A2R4T1F2_9ACTN|nr:hypothetical protein [Streptomyces lunaelactis]AVZ72965.1 hypothetical protein SLUN_12950 [Streptomyces lunaelactis]NUK87137.1 hypothetical protein [Streptomyces lunaelactis]